MSHGASLIKGGDPVYPRQPDDHSGDAAGQDHDESAWSVATASFALCQAAGGRNEGYGSASIAILRS
jgi:hypothetical protein